MTNDPDIVLLGRPVAQSRSPIIHNAALRAAGIDLRYGVREVGAWGIAEAVAGLREGRLVGANVTAPHKRVAFRSVDQVTPAARATGSVNVLWKLGDEVWGDNTDVIGVRASFAALGVDVGRVTVLGAGGAAAAAVVAALDLGDVTVVNRTRAHAERMLEVVQATSPDRSTTLHGWHKDGLATGFSSACVIVNATSVSAAEEPGLWTSLPWECARSAALLDLCYAAEPTSFVAAAPPQCQALDGATMLLHQAVAGFERWTGTRAPIAVMRAALATSLGRSSADIG